MIRKLLLPALLVGLLGGCVTAGYGYRDGYYYGQPSVEYRYHDYGYPYSYYPYYGYGYYPYAPRYRYDYPYYGRYPYYYPYHRQPKPKPPVSGTPGPRPGDNDDYDPPPWRDLNRRRRLEEPGNRPQQANAMTPYPPTPEPQRREVPRRENRGEGSRMQQAVQRAQESRRRRSGDPQEP